MKWSPTPALNCVPEQAQKQIEQQIEQRVEPESHNEITSRFSNEYTPGHVSQHANPSVANTNHISHEINFTHIPVIPRESLPEHGISVHETTRRLNPTYHLKPFIKCPQNTTILLPQGQKTVYIKLEQPKTNVDWRSQVDAYPQWAKRLEAHLTAGVHIVNFRARSLNNNLTDVCRSVFTVKGWYSTFLSFSLAINFNLNISYRASASKSYLLYRILQGAASTK